MSDESGQPALQQETGALQGERDELTTERDRLLGQVQQQASDLKSLQQQLKDAQDAAEAARVGVSIREDSIAKCRGAQRRAASKPSSFLNHRDQLAMKADVRRSADHQ